jgi:cysteine desulfurase
VLMAMGQTAAQARSSLRFSFGRNNSQQEVNKAVDLVRQAVEIIKS